MKRFYIQAEQITKDNKISIEDSKQIKYIRKVLRFSTGDQIVLFDGIGNEYYVVLEIVSKEQIIGEILSMSSKQDDAKYELVLAQALPKAGKLDDIVRMNTEVGVAAFILFESEFGMVKKEKYTDKKLDRLQRVAVEASKQSERAIIPQITGPIDFRDIFEQEADIKILMHSRDIEGSIDINDLKSEVISQKLKKILIVIGPEGGFSPKEIQLAEKNGFKLGYLDLPILRTETAGVVCSGILLS